MVLTVIAKLTPLGIYNIVRTRQIDHHTSPHPVEEHAVEAGGDLCTLSCARVSETKTIFAAHVAMTILMLASVKQQTAVLSMQCWKADEICIDELQEVAAADAEYLYSITVPQHSTTFHHRVCKGVWQHTCSLTAQCDTCVAGRMAAYQPQGIPYQPQGIANLLLGCRLQRLLARQHF